MAERRASASPWVRFFRRFSSSPCGPPGPKRSSYFLNSMRFAPKVCRLPMMLLLKPVMMATIAITVVTPTTMPRTVSVERSLCSRMDPAAKRTLPAKLRTKTARPLRTRVSLIAQGLHGGEARRGRRGGQAGQEAGDRGRDHPDHDEGRLDRGREDLAHGQRDQGARDHSSRPAHR